jgi:hypothetical protein
VSLGGIIGEVNPEHPKKLAKGLAAGAGGVGISAILLWQLQAVSGRVEKMDERLQRVAERVTALHVKVFGTASVAPPMHPPSPLATPGPHPESVWADLLPFPVPHGEKR